MQFHLLSFEGPDAYARAGGLASRVTGLSAQLAALGFETHLWFIGDPHLPGYEQVDGVHLHRWSQWLSAHHPGGVYDGEASKREDYARSLPTHLVNQLAPVINAGKSVTVLAEEWHTVDAVLHLDHLLRLRRMRQRVRILWNANNTFGFQHIDWDKLSRAATVTTVSRYMKHAMQPLGVESVVIPNGLEPAAYAPVHEAAAREFGAQMSRRMLVAKVARFDPDKRWLGAVDVVAELKRRGARPLFVARGGVEAHGNAVLERACNRGLRIIERYAAPGVGGLIDALRGVEDVDMVQLTSHLDQEARHLLFGSAAAVLANSAHEPFGLVGLEAMAAGGVACTGISGEDYAVPGHNAIVLQTAAPAEAIAKIERLRTRPAEEQALRREGIATALKYAWQSVIERNLIPQVELTTL